MTQGNNNYRFWNKNNLFLNLFILLLSNILVQAGYTPNGCKPIGTKTAGATVKFYNYPLWDLTTWDTSSFLLGGYTKYGYLETITGVTELTYRSATPHHVLPYGASGFVPENFTMEITGYYLAPQSGIYTISLGADDYATVILGDGEAFQCCSQNVTYVSTHFVATNADGAIPNAENQFATQEEIYLEANVLYPVKIVFVNNRDQGALQVGFNLPDGTAIDDIGPYLVSLDDSNDDNCGPIFKSHVFTTHMTTTYLTTTIQAKSSIPGPTTVTTLTTTSWKNDDNGVVEIKYTVETPTPVPTTTTITTTNS
ncbi:hypothetical protein C6P44_001688, partial [Monosporozyma unispora]